MIAAAVILAGGASTRMGQPKALLMFQGETFLDRLIGIFSRCCGDVVVVLGYEADRIRAAVSRNARFVVNPNPEDGQLSSLQCGLRALAGDAAFFFTPVDCPSIAAGTPAALLDALAADPGALLAIPRCDGKRGHPVLCHAALRDEFLALPRGAQARQVVKRHTEETIYADVEDPGIAADVDDPADYSRLLAKK